MRLTPVQVEAIRDATVQAFGADAIVRLFGSRTDDARLGGDIDLHIEAAPERATVDNEVQFRALLWKSLDEPQIDVVISARGSAPRWVDRAAAREGITL